MTDVQYVVAVAGKLADLFKGQGTLLGDAVDLRVRQDHGMIPAPAGQGLPLGLEAPDIALSYVRESQELGPKGLVAHQAREHVHHRVI